jgi:uncharacterized protein
MVRMFGMAVNPGRDRLSGLGLSLLLGTLLLGCGNQSSPSATPSTSPAAVSASTTVAMDPKLPLPQQLPLTMAAQINGQTFKLAVAKTPKQQEIGLMYRSDIPASEGMLFPFDPPKTVVFWMKGTLTALDIIYLRDGVIRDLFADTPPCKADPCPYYSASADIDQVIELRAGTAKQYGFKVGDRVTLTPLKN